MTTSPTLGGLPIDLPRLMETRAPVQANSGGGKSFCLRRILDQTAGGVQQLAIDPEGELQTLRKQFDEIVCSLQRWRRRHATTAAARIMTLHMLAIQGNRHHGRRNPFPPYLA